ncbi:probable WRKY transcription factor 51 [Tripterygium wilfordii]|uniref:probable WRKY transcription factor 51 n=1 Tax=Tripterygium wilfordii TaxID=458696 RepID=UPI0018F82F39|nr:probable WRKY transcription factor 51 [Tripterygium wilfordii]
MDHTPNQNPNPNFTHYSSQFVDPLSSSDFEFSEYLNVDGVFDDDHSSSPSMVSSDHIGGSSTGHSVAPSIDTTMRSKNGVKKNKTEATHRVAFRTQSELEVMDDGYKWRKYGKKSVKNSPNPRNYYKCITGGCYVKKRVERDREDSSYVITTYEGVHNHESPGVVYYNQMPPNAWNFQQSLQSSTSYS